MENTRQFQAIITISKGKILQVGKIEYQVMLSGAILQGGADQILLAHGYPTS